LEDFATQIATSSTSESIAQVFDQYLNFIVGEPDLFSLGMGKDRYWQINKAEIKDEELDAVVDKTVSGLFSVVVTMGESYPRKWTGRMLNLGVRSYPHHPMSERRSGRIDLGKARS